METYWAIRHTGGCSGKLHGYTLCSDKVLAEIHMKRHCGDKDCKIVRVTVVEVQESLPFSGK